MAFSPFSAARPSRPIRVANCSGALTDPGILMCNQAKHGPVDVITGDYLAEATMASSAVQRAQSNGPGWIQTALDGIQLSLDIINEKRIKIVINGGAMNPKGLAERVHAMINQKGLKLRVGYVEGDNLMHKVHHLLSNSHTHLDKANPDVQYAKDTMSFLDLPEEMPILAANAYLGYRAIQKGLDEGADILICGRVSDASPVIGAAAWWYNWSESDLDQLAGSLIAGHLIECSTYVTGGNFAGAHKHPPSHFLRLGAGIAEILPNGECIITKHDPLNGFVTPDTVKCQLLYELQGNIYLNSDVKADISNVAVARESKNRVHVFGVKGHPPPPTTKLAVFYRGGYQCELLVNACGNAIDHKWDIQELQLRDTLQELGILDKLDVLDFQRIGTAMEDPDSQFASTTYMRIFAQSKDKDVLGKMHKAWHYQFMSHFPGTDSTQRPPTAQKYRDTRLIPISLGMHFSLDTRSLVPKAFVGYYPAIVSQNEIEETVTILGENSAEEKHCYAISPPNKTEPLAPRENYETKSPVSTETFGPAVKRPLGDVVLARSGDKGGNINIGLFVQTAEQWEWFRSFLAKDRLQTLMRKDWKDWYFLERVEFENIYAVHFVVYGPLGRGVTSSSLLDSLGKGFAEFICAVHVDIPLKFLEESAHMSYIEHL
nr:du1446 domain containing protein [Trichoderma psychrophilum]